MHEVFLHFPFVLKCQGGQLSRGEEIFPDFHKVEDENGALLRATAKLIHSIDNFSISLLIINMYEIDI